MVPAEIIITVIPFQRSASPSTSAENRTDNRLLTFAARDLCPDCASEQFGVEKRTVIRRFGEGATSWTRFRRKRR